MSRQRFATTSGERPAFLDALVKSVDSDGNTSPTPKRLAPLEKRSPDLRRQIAESVKEATSSNSLPSKEASPPSPSLSKDKGKEKITHGEKGTDSPSRPNYVEEEKSSDSLPMIKDLGTTKTIEETISLLNSESIEEQLEGINQVVSHAIISSMNVDELRDKGGFAPLVALLKLKKGRTSDFFIEAVRALQVLVEFNDINKEELKKLGVINPLQSLHKYPEPKLQEEAKILLENFGINANTSAGWGTRLRSFTVSAASMVSKLGDGGAPKNAKERELQKLQKKLEEDRKKTEKKDKEVKKAEEKEFKKKEKEAYLKYMKEDDSSSDEEEQIKEIEKLKDPELREEQLSKLKLQSFLIDNTEPNGGANNNNNGGSTYNNSYAFPDTSAWQGFSNTTGDSGFNFKI